MGRNPLGRGGGSGRNPLGRGGGFRRKRWIRFGLPALTLSTVVALTVGLLAPRRPHATRVEVVQTTSDLSQRMTHLSDLRFGSRPPPGIAVIHVQDSVRYQRIAGVGAALTDTSAWLLHDELSPAARAGAMSNLFGAAGIHLGYVRVPIGASDYTRSGAPYSYDDVARGRSDPGLTRFSVAHDDAYTIPILRQMLAVNPRAVILASPWSPPGWMKDNRALDNLGDRGRLLRTAYDPLAQYFIKFIRAYASRGVPIAAITPQNEPGQSSAYPGLNLPESSQASFIAGHLAPALATAGLHTKIYGHDYKWLRWRDAQALARSPAVKRAIAGIAWHCYDGDPAVMTALHRSAPGLDQSEDECATGSAPGAPAELLIATIRNWASTVLLWNLALDPHGGPVQPPNYGCPHCTGVLTVDERTHTVSYGSDYYQLGQLSAFIAPGARRIKSGSFVSYNSPDRNHRVNYASAGIDDVALENPGGRKVLMAYNNAKQPRRFAVDWHGRAFVYTLAPGATVTFAWQ